MATKAELEAELARLRTLNESLSSKAEQNSESKDPTDTSAQAHLAEGVQRVLDEHGIDRASVERMGGKLIEELSTLQKEYPLAVLLSAFALGCVAGRALR